MRLALTVLPVIDFDLEIQVFTADLFIPVVHSVEQRTFNPWVDASSPSGPT